MVDQNGLKPRIQFNSELIAATWDPSTHTYILQVEETTTGHILSSTCHVLISAAGNFPRPRFLNVPGTKTFTGELFHSSRWNTGIDLKNKRVAVVGNGTSACVNSADLLLV